MAAEEAVMDGGFEAAVADEAPVGVVGARIDVPEAEQQDWPLGYIDGELADASRAEREEAAQLDAAGKYEPGVTLVGIPQDVLAKLLPGEDVIVLEKPKVAGGLCYRFVKRAFDMVSTALALVVLAIPMGLVALKIKSESPGPVIYSQTRVGKGGKPFNVYKFRSMYIDAEAHGAQWAQGDDPRVTPFGKFMREKRIDEIPQFWNILRGDIPSRILKMRPELSEKSVGAFALPAKSSTNKNEAFSQVKAAVAANLRTRRVAIANSNLSNSAEPAIFAKPIFGAVAA